MTSNKGPNKGPNFLSRAQIDEILEGMTARDIFSAMPSGSDPSEQAQGAEIAAKTFEAAAERQGHGALALDRVGPADAVYLAQALGEAFGSGPKESDTASSPDSPVSGA